MLFADHQFFGARADEQLGINHRSAMAPSFVLMDGAAYSFAMVNAHPLLKERTRFLAPGNADNGVVRTIKSVLGIA